MGKATIKKRPVRRRKPAQAEAPFVTYLSSLGHENVQVLKPIPVTVQTSGEECTATFYDAGISTSGESSQEAVTNLQRLIADMFLIHEQDRTSVRGPRMKQQQTVLQEFLCRR